MKQNIIEMRNRAFEIIRDKSLVLGPVTLSSGERSDHYFDMKPAMFDPEGSNLLCRLILHRLSGVEAGYIGGLEMGAVPLIASLVLVSGLEGRPIPGFFVRKATKEHGTRKVIEGAGDLRGKHVVVLEDVTTTGGSALTAIAKIKDAGADVSVVISILDRQQGAAEAFQRAGIPFQSLFKSADFLVPPAGSQAE